MRRLEPSSSTPQVLGLALHGKNLSLRDSLATLLFQEISISPREINSFSLGKMGIPFKNGVVKLALRVKKPSSVPWPKHGPKGPSLRLTGQRCLCVSLEFVTRLEFFYDADILWHQLWEDEHSTSISFSPLLFHDETLLNKNLQSVGGWAKLHYDQTRWCSAWSGMHSQVPYTHTFF